MIGTVRNSAVSKLILIGMAQFCASLSSGADFDGSIEIETQSSFSRLKVSLDSSFKPVFTETAKGFKIEVPAATLMDVGVPFGSEKGFNDFLKSQKDERIAGLRVRELESKLVIEGEYRFPKGEKAFSSPKMEHFDFRRDEQGKFLVDFFYRKGPTRTQALAVREREKSRLERERIQLLLKKEEEKRVSRERRIEDGRNALLFCEQPFSRNTTVFLRFRAEHLPLRFGSYFPEKVPDHRFQYEEPKGSGEEAEMVRLALKLSRDNQHALVVKTVQFLEKEYPKSRYLNEMLFLKANAFYRMGFEDRGKELLRDLSIRAKGSEVGLQTAGFLAAQSFENQEWLAALQSFMNLKKEMPDHPLSWLFRYGIAECLYQIKQGDQAREEFDWLARNAPKPEIRAEAAFKSGDVFFDRGQYAQAVASYLSGLKGRDAYLGRYPSVLLNLAESYFQLEEFDRAEEQFKRFREVGAAQPTAWKSGLRLAEIEAMKSKLGPSAEKAFMETINRYPLSDGALISRIRLLPCGSHGGFDLPAAERLIASPEVSNFTGSGAVYASQFKELAGLTEVRMLVSFREFQKAIDRGVARLRENPSVETRKLIEQAMIGAIKEILEKKLKEGDVFGSIAFYEKYGDYLPLPAHDPLADDLKMKLATVAAERNLTQFALKLIEPYRKMNEASQKEVIEAIQKHVTLEGIDDQESRNLIEAKTLWNSPDFKAQDPVQSSQFLGRLAYIRDGSRSAFERDVLLALFHFEKEEFTKSLEFSKKMVQGSQKLPARTRAQVWGFAAEVAGRASDLEFLEKSAREASLALKASDLKDQDELTFRHLSAVPAQSYLVQLQGEALEKQEKWKEAVALYSRAVENKIGGNHILYSHAKAILKAGGKDSKKLAGVSLEKIQQSQDDDVWKRLAQEKLNEIAKEGKNDGKRNP